MQISPPLRTVPLIAALLGLGHATAAVVALGQRPDAFPAPVPVRQATVDPADPPRTQPLTLRDVSHDDRWLGVGVRSVRWAPDGSAVYFRWHPSPSTDDDPDADPWFRVDRAGETVARVADTATHRIPPSAVEWSRDGRRAAWSAGERLYVYADGRTRLVHTATARVRNVRISGDGAHVDFMVRQDLLRYPTADGVLRRLARPYSPDPDRRGEAEEWLEQQQLELFRMHREDRRREREADARERRLDPSPAQPIPVESGARLDDVALSPDGRFVTFRSTEQPSDRKPTQYLDYLDRSGWAEVRDARPKVGAPQDDRRLGIVRYEPRAHPDSVDVAWVELADAGDRETIVHGPYWSLEGDRAVVQVMSLDHKDLWIAELDPATGETTVIEHLHDDAWLGGPPIQPNYFGPTLLEWIPDGRFVFASERTGWSHLYLAEPDGTVRPLTRGEWEVRSAELSRDRSTWLIAASREHPADDHLYTMPAAGGELTRLTQKPGRHEGVLSPDGRRLAVVYSESVQLPDLFLRDARPEAAATRITVSGTDDYYTHDWVRPEIVSFRHPDGDPLWAAVFEPGEPAPERAAVMHVHGGGYRQFAHRGWSVYGYASHIGFINWLVQQGYTVIDFDYRGSAGFGRDYRTDIYRSMGHADVDGATAAVDYLVREYRVDRSRVGVYGVSYGGFFTLMALFRHPGLFAAGVANAAVADWAHYNHTWTRRILNEPASDPEAYRRSSPIYHADGLEDELLIVHSLTDGNVQFQDAARLMQKLIELEKPFRVMTYPSEPHVIASEPSRYDFHRRVSAFFREHLLERAPVGTDGTP